jgi:cation:H+ antiporter
MWLWIVLLIVGFVFIIKGADWLIDGSSSLARKYHLSELTIGLTIVAFGTSAPELVVSLFASAGGYGQVLLGNIIGSNIFNLLLILGISGLISPIPIQDKTIRNEIPYSIFAGMLILVLGNDSWFSANDNILRWYDGAIFLVFFLFFLLYSYRNRKGDLVPEVPAVVFGSAKTVLLILAGLILLVVGGRLVVENAVKMAQSFGISEKIIGLTLIAGGTSLPELAASAVAAWKKRSGLAIGNVIGSNIFNILFILGTSVTLTSVPYPPSFNMDVILYLIVSLVLLASMYTGVQKQFDRWEAAIFLLLYCGYIVFLFFR